MSGPCPKSEALMDLLDHSVELAPTTAAGLLALRAHVAGCAACREELAALEAGFAAMDPVLAPAPDPAALARIERAVLAADAAAERAVLAEDAGPGRRTGALAGLLVAFALFAAVLALWRLGRGHETHAPLAGITAAGIGALAFVARGLRPAPQSAALLGGLAALSAIALAESGDIVVPLLRGATCLALAASGAALPAATLWWIFGPSRRSARGGALLGAAIFSGGVAQQVAFCPLGGLAHAAVFHVAPLLVGVAACALIGWRAGARRGADAP